MDQGGAIIDAVSAMPWSGEAQVTVSIVNWQKGGTPPAVRTLWIDPDTEPLELPEMTAALSPRINLRSAIDIKTNEGGVFQGQTFGVVGAFRVGGFAAAKAIKQRPDAASAILPVLGGDEMLKKISVDDWIIDIPEKSADNAWKQFPELMKSLESTALVDRQAKADKERERNAVAIAANPKAKVNKHHAGFLDRWWTIAWRREQYLKSTAGLDRYIALTRTSSEKRGPVFSFVSGEFRVSDSIVAFPFSDDYSLGILQSSVHEIWFRERCTTLETRLTYTSEAVFDSFPWPQHPEQEPIDRVTRATTAIVAYRADAFRQGASLAAQYDVLRRPGKSKLRDLHSELNAAVLDLYGFDKDEDLLTQILELNLLVGQREATDQEVTRPGRQPTSEPASTWAWPAPKLPF